MSPADAPTVGQLDDVINNAPEPESAAESLRAALGVGETHSDAITANATGDAQPLEGTQPPDSVPVDGNVLPPERVQNREVDGRYAEGFQQQQQAAQEEQRQAAQQEQQQQAAQQQQEQQQQELQALEPVPAWDLEDATTFRKMPPEHQHFMMKMLGAQSEQIPAAYQPIEAVLAPRRDAWARLGQTPEAALQQLLTISDFAETRPADFIQWFAQNRGINLGQQQEQQSQQQQQSALDQAIAGLEADDPILNDPIFTALRQEVATLRQALGGINTQFQRGQQAQESQVRQAAVQTLENMRTAADSQTGQLLYPYFDEVRHLMGAFVDPQSGQVAQTLEEAYDMACRAHPKVHEKIAAAQTARAERERQAQEREKAAKAQTAAVSVSGTTGTTAPTAPTGDLRTDLKNEFASRGMYGVEPATI